MVWFEIAGMSTTTQKVVEKRLTNKVVKVWQFNNCILRLFYSYHFYYGAEGKQVDPRACHARDSGFESHRRRQSAPTLVGRLATTINKLQVE